MAANHGRRYLPISRPSPTSPSLNPPKNLSPQQVGRIDWWGVTKRQADVTENIFSKVGQRNPPIPDGFRPTDVEAKPWSQNFPPTGPPKSRSVPIRWFGIFIQRLPRSKRRIANRDSLRWEFERTGGTRNVERDLGTKINPKFTSPISERIQVHFPDLQDQSL